MVQILVSPMLDEQLLHSPPTRNGNVFQCFTINIIVMEGGQMTGQDVLLPTNYNHFIINDKLELLVQYGCDFPFRMNPGPPKQITVCKMNIHHLQSNGGND